MSKSIREYWPQLFDNILDFQLLADAVDTEIQSLGETVDQQLADQFVLTSGYEAVKRRERMLGIQADPTNETLDFRKKRIINRYSTKPPFTIRYLQDRLDFLVGEEKAIVSADGQDFLLFVETAIENAALFKEVERTIKTIKPANLIYNQQTALGDHISLEEHIRFRTLERQTRLGSTWRVGMTPFAVADLEVSVK
ncbi:putative phage tail protein [Desulfitobacterium hafniense]|uniref:putative phage tail protein n=1 Tax=Desulfitobacterium hafniense TaxID=49338 RepID=UPI000380867F|nr:putative phage tail protein [Desulfitobacterium hafniense]